MRDTDLIGIISQGYSTQGVFENRIHCAASLSQINCDVLIIVIIVFNADISAPIQSCPACGTFGNVISSSVRPALNGEYSPPGITRMIFLGVSGECFFKFKYFVNFGKYAVSADNVFSLAYSD